MCVGLKNDQCAHSLEPTTRTHTHLKTQTQSHIAGRGRGCSCKTIIVASPSKILWNSRVHSHSLITLYNTKTKRSCGGRRLFPHNVTRVMLEYFQVEKQTHMINGVDGLHPKVYTFAWCAYVFVVVHSPTHSPKRTYIHTCLYTTLICVYLWFALRKKRLKSNIHTHQAAIIYSPSHNSIQYAQYTYSKKHRYVCEWRRRRSWTSCRRTHSSGSFTHTRTPKQRWLRQYERDQHICWFLNVISKYCAWRNNSHFIIQITVSTV